MRLENHPSCMAKYVNVIQKREERGERRGSSTCMAEYVNVIQKREERGGDPAHTQRPFAQKEMSHDKSATRNQKKRCPTIKSAIHKKREESKEGIFGQDSCLLLHFRQVTDAKRLLVFFCTSGRNQRKPRTFLC